MFPLTGISSIIVWRHYVLGSFCLIWDTKYGWPCGQTNQPKTFSHYITTLAVPFTKTSESSLLIPPRYPFIGTKLSFLLPKQIVKWFFSSKKKLMCAQRGVFPQNDSTIYIITNTCGDSEQSCPPVPVGTCLLLRKWVIDNLKLSLMCHLEDLGDGYQGGQSPRLRS